MVYAMKNAPAFYIRVLYATYIYIPRYIFYLENDQGMPDIENGMCAK